MRVEFTVDEAHRMFEAVLDELVALDLDKHDRATLRRWRADEMTPGSVAVQRLCEKLNEGIQHSHDRSEASPIKKPDWV
ncbi:MAG: hypothetical protein EXR65_05245 [Dehalococcoidia bacterium]|nr:hypothetical protein [Dehalococcoidia bacterium]